MDPQLKPAVLTWWRAKAEAVGRIISSTEADELSVEIATMLELNKDECIAVAREDGLVSGEKPILQPKGLIESPQQKTEGEIMAKHPEAGLMVKDFIKKYWVECKGGNVKALFEKAKEIGLKTTPSTIASAKSNLKVKDNWKPPQGEEVFLLLPVNAPITVGENKVRKGKKNPADVLVEELQKSIANYENQIAKLRADIAAIERVQELGLV